MPDERGEELRPIPKNREAEQVVLGCCMLEPAQTLPTVISMLKPSHFYFPAHQEVYKAILELYEHGKLPDFIAVANHLEEHGKLEKVGGRAYLAELISRVPTVAALEHYAEIVRTKALRRALIEGGGRIMELGYREDLPVDQALDRAEGVIFEIAQRETTKDYILLRDFLYEHMEHLEELHRDPKRHPVKAISTGFTEFDARTGGFRPAEFIVIAGRPGMGKTSFVLTLLRHIAVEQKKRVAIFSLEMTREQLLERLLCAEAKVDLHRLRSGYLPPPKWAALAEAASHLHEAMIFIDDSPSTTVLEIKAKARRIAMEHGLDLVIIDYLQLVDAGIRADVREQEIAYISRSLKALARELEIPVIACSQLNRAVERRESKRPQLSDLRESGAIEQDADLVVFIHRPDYYEGQRGSEISESEIIIAKQRNGPLGTFRLHFHKSYVTFYEPAKEEVPF
ncbi:replicative DNA helicase [Candidatus Acetothermia bacterium]|nr:MAG: replicative DNA helicase [Candidatus Acetothermia bacterium]